MVGAPHVHCNKGSVEGADDANDSLPQTWQRYQRPVHLRLCVGILDLGVGIVHTCRRWPALSLEGALAGLSKVRSVADEGDSRQRLKKV
eukprot:scaffold116137_cov35-Tisochrysis_lutea.AAC.1